MAEHTSRYLIIGAGLAGASAVEGIRERDPQGSIAMIGAEEGLPYDRPPLSKKLWLGKQELKDIFLHDQAFYDQKGVVLFLGRRAVALDVTGHTVADSQGESHRYEKLLLATGSAPRTLPVPGGDLAGLCYYRTIDDYRRTRREAVEGRSAVVIGGGFIGSEMAAALCANKVNVTMIFPMTHLCNQVFPEDLGLALEGVFRSRGIRILKGQKPATIERDGARFVVRTDGGQRVEADLAIAGVGAKPAVELAEGAGLANNDGVLVDERLRASHPDVYAAGDNARFPYRALGELMRLEHWDNALNQGRLAGRNMAGAGEPFTYMPYFFSDLFEFGYEAVGEVASRLETVADWQKPFETGVIYYRRDGKVRGAMMCNVWGKVDAARELIRRGLPAVALAKAGETVSPESLRGAIR
jgi:NADPH-dependent 2,4-dienoyl-CoA reductase/sulfur reductase-like enzyme